MKKSQKKIGAILLILLAVFALSGCGGDTQKAEQKKAEAGKEEVQKEGDSSTQTITDMMGREVEIPKTVNTVATLGSTARLLTYAGCADKIVGLSELETKGQVEMPYAYVNAEKFATLPPVSSGGANSKTYEEALATLKPDVIFANYAKVDDMNTLQEKLQIPIIILEYDGVFDESVYKAIGLVGEVMGTQEQCEKILTSMKDWQMDLEARTKDIAKEDKPRVYPGAVSFRGGHGIEGTHGKYPPFVAIHAENVVDETGQSSPIMVEKEKILQWNPDIIFLTPGNMHMVNDDYKKNPDYYKSLKAIKEGKVFSQINYNYYGCNIELAIADAYYAGSVIYPKAFEDLDFEKKGEEIFTTMLGRPYMEILKETGNRFEKLTVGSDMNDDK